MPENNDQEIKKEEDLSNPFSINDSDTENTDNQGSNQDNQATETKKEVKKEESLPQTNIAGGTQTITDRQSVMARNAYQQFKKLSNDEVVVLLETARNAAQKDQTLLKADAKRFQYQYDQSLGTMLACQALLQNASKSTPSLQSLVDSSKAYTSKSLGFSENDCNKITNDLNNPKADWKNAERKSNIQTLNESKNKTGTIMSSSIPEDISKRVAKEAQSIKDTDIKDIVAQYNDVRKNAREAKSLANADKENPAAQEAYQQSTAKLLAYQYTLKNSTNLDAQKTVIQNRDMLSTSFDFQQRDVDALFKDTENQLKNGTLEEELKQEEPQKEEPKAEQTVETPKAEEKPAEKVNDAAIKSKERLDAQCKTFSEVTGLKKDGSYAEYLQKSIKNIQSQPKELREHAFMSLIENEYRENMKSAMLNSQQRESQGLHGCSPIEAVNQTDALMRASFDYLKASGAIKGELPFLAYGGMSPNEITNRLEKGYQNLPADRKTNDSRKELTAFQKSVSTQIKDSSYEKMEFLTQGLNKCENTQFSAPDIKNYLDSRWKASADLDANMQQINFRNELKFFANKAFEAMSNQTTDKTDLKNQTNNFNQFMEGVQAYCKSNGWIDPDVQFEPFGGLSAEDMGKMQKTAIGKLPKNKTEWAQKEIQPAPKQEKTEELPYNPFVIRETPPKGPSKEEQMQEKVNNLPKVEEGKEISEDAQKAVAYCQELDKLHGSRSKAWKFFHPFKNKSEQQLLDNLTKSMEEKGYLTSNENGKKEWIKSGDELKERHEEQILSTDETVKENEKIIKTSNSKEFNEISVKDEEKLDFTDIEGIDTAKEINNPTTVSQPINEKDLNVSKMVQVQASTN